MAHAEVVVLTAMLRLVGSICEVWGH